MDKGDLAATGVVFGIVLAGLGVVAAVVYVIVLAARFAWGH